MLLNLGFSLLAIGHLTYLGSMFDPGVDEQEAEEVGPRFTLSFQSKRDQVKLYVLLVCHCRAIGPATPSTGGPSSTGPATGWWWPAGSSTASSSEQSRQATHLCAGGAV